MSADPTPPAGDDKPKPPAKRAAKKPDATPPAPTPAPAGRPLARQVRRVLAYLTPALLALVLLALVVGLLTRPAPVPPPADGGRDDVARLTTKLDALDARLDGLDAKVDSPDTRTALTAATGKLSDATTQLAALNATVNGLAGLPAAVNDPKDGLKKRVSDADAKLVTLGQTADAAKKAAEEGKAAATDAKTTAADAKTAANAAKTAAESPKDPPGLKQVGDDVGNLSDKMTRSNQDVAILKKEVQGVNGLVAQLVAFAQQQAAPTDVLVLACHTDSLDVRKWVPTLAKALDREPTRALAPNHRLAVMVVHDGEVQDGGLRAGGEKKGPPLLPWPDAKTPQPAFVTQLTTANEKHVADLQKVNPADHFPAADKNPPARRLVLVADPRDPPPPAAAWKGVAVDVLLIARDALPKADEAKSKAGAAAWAEFALDRGGLVARVTAPEDLSAVKGEPPALAEVVRHLRRLTAAHR